MFSFQKMFIDKKYTAVDIFYWDYQQYSNIVQSLVRDQALVYVEMEYKSIRDIFVVSN